MPGIFTSLVSSANALRVYERSIATIESNVANVSTPGYARQRLLPRPLPLDIEAGLPGGIITGEMQSARNEYSEQAVRREQHFWGRYDQAAADLGRLEPVFDVTGSAGIPAALNRLFQRFSAWGVAPNDSAARRNVIEGARDVAARFSEIAGAVQTASSTANQEIRSTVDTINRLAGTVRDLNVELRRNFQTQNQAGVDARLQSTLEELAEYVDFTVLYQPDGSVTLLAGNQTALVVGDNLYEIEASFTSSSAAILDANGADVTAYFTGGRLAGMLEFKNSHVPELLSGLNALAKGLADRVNGLLASGLDTNGNPGAALFTYNSADDAAFTIRAVELDVSELAAASAGAPGGNGNALALAALAGSDEIGGVTFTEYYAGIAARAGSLLNSARENAHTQEQLLLQARALRQEISGVSLDEEAVHLMEFERAYQAISKVVQVLDDLTEATIDMLR